VLGQALVYAQKYGRALIEPEHILLAMTEADLPVVFESLLVDKVEIRKQLHKRMAA
jgi:hypothetical protein